MRRSLSTITLGMLAFLLMLSTPVSAQKVVKLSPTIDKEVVLKKAFNKKINEKENGFQTIKAVEKQAKFKDFARLLKDYKKIKPIGLMKTARVVSEQDEAIVPPYAEAWDGTNNENYIIIDANEDYYEDSYGAHGVWVINTTAQYKYSASSAADDWLLTPKLQLEAGEVYNFETAISCQLASYYNERIEILFGQGDDPAAYTTVLLEPTDIVSSAVATFTATINPTESGEYRIGFHAISDADKYNININSWSISKLISTVPGEVTDLAVVPAEGGALNAFVSFIAPSVDLAGDVLETITKIEIKSGDIVEIIDNPNPGSQQGITITVPQSGTYTFEITAYNDDGAGATVTSSPVFIGLDSPTYVNNMYAVDNHDGTATFNWDPYEEEIGANGGYLDLSTLKYNVYSITESGYLGDLIATVTDPTITIDCPDWNTGDNDFFYAVVAPEVNGNEGGFNFASIIIGEPDGIPYAEGFSKEGLNYFWWTNTYMGDTSWSLTSAFDTNGDGACAYFYPEDVTEDGYVASTAASLNTGKISVKGATAPTLTFKYSDYYKGYFGENVTLWVWVDLQNGEEPETIFESTGEEEEETWNQVAVDLSKYVNEDYIIVSFVAISNDYEPLLLLDDVNIKDAAFEDLSLSIEAPEQVVAGEDINVTATVANSFMNIVAGGSYSVVFTANDKEFATITETEDLDAFAGVATYTATYPSSLFDQPAVNIKVEVVYDQDAKLDNNVAEAEVALLISDLPTVDDLSGVVEINGNVSLTWSAPEGFATYTEDFEEGQGEFTTIDANQDDFVWEYYNSEGNKTHSGTGVMTSFSYDNDTYSAIQPNDWLITPQVKLTGDFSFYACGQDASYAAEHFAVFVSTTVNDDPSAFTQVSEEFEATGVMTKYSVDLSSYEGVEGYVAIRHFNCYDMFRLNIDDVTYTPVNADPIVIAGYNVYRDGELIGTATDTEFVDDTVEEFGEHTYNVTVLIGEEESNLSNDFTIDVWLPGDVDHDGEVSISDVQAVVAYILGSQPEVFYETEANLDGDEEISISDVNMIVNIILGAPSRTPKNARTTLDKVYMTSDANGYNIHLDANEVYTGCEMTIQLPNGCKLVGAKAANGVTVKTNALENGTYRLVAYTSEGQKINSQDAIIRLSVTGDNNDEVSISDILFTNPMFELISFNAVEGVVTGIADVKAQAEDAPTYNLQGVQVNETTRGIYVRNGKKFVVK